MVDSGIWESLILVPLVLATKACSKFLKFFVMSLSLMFDNVVIFFAYQIFAWYTDYQQFSLCSFSILLGSDLK